MTEKLTTYRTHDIPTPVPEYVDTEDQLVIGSERDFLDLQTPEQVREIGAYALRKAQELIDLAYHCEDYLIEYQDAPKRRGKRVDVSSKLVVFEGDEA